MSELSRLVESPVSVKVSGKEYLVSPIQLRHVGAGQVEMRKSRPPVVREAAEAGEGLSAETKKILFEAAVAEYAKQHTVTITESLVWLTQDSDGIAYLLWMLIVESNGGKSDGVPTRADIAEWLAKLSPSDATRIVDALLAPSGGDELGNCSSKESTTQT